MSQVGCELHMVTTLHGGVRTGGGESSRLESSSVHLAVTRRQRSLFTGKFPRPPTHEAEAR